MEPFQFLQFLREKSLKPETLGLNQKQVESFLKSDSDLREAISFAQKEWKDLETHHKPLLDKLLSLKEIDQVAFLQEDILNFYAKEAVNPYVPLGAKGPWIITLSGAVVHDSGGYGMLGFGQNYEPITNALSKPFMMANVMTASTQQKEFTTLMKAEIGLNRFNKCPFDKFVCLNSGSEAMTLALRISDIHAKKVMEKTGKKKNKFVILDSGFHGRTDRPAQVSHNSLKAYQAHLASFQSLDNLYVVEPNNLKSLQNAFDTAIRENVHIEAMVLEPVMGEGNPGQSITPEFYSLARDLTFKHDSLLLIDSIQAGFRARGCLSIVDYPGFEKLPAPDMESYSKAINGGQFPLSTLSLEKRISGLYAIGVYGNTMTTTPRALKVACAVLKSFTPALRLNIVKMGELFVREFEKIKRDFPTLVSHVQGTGLIFSLGIFKDKLKVVSENGLEIKLRKMGIGVIHGGENSLRFTPVFDITADEVYLICDVIRESLST